MEFPFGEARENEKLLANSSRRAHFTYSAWKSPQLLARISEVAGIDLVPSMDFESATTNISLNSAGGPETDDNESDTPSSAVAWHYDSCPFVCVTMLSDCTGMIGGETALRLPNGKIRKVRGPAMVCLTRFVGGVITWLTLSFAGHGCRYAGEVH